jgi:hypothetical protein
MKSKSRCPALVKLRSAEADPHVTKRAIESAGEPADPAPTAPRAATRRCWPGVSWGRPCSAFRVSPTEAGELVPLPHSSIWSLRHRPLPGATVNPARVEQLTSGLYSADESVAAHRRFQRCAARFSHGLGSPSRSPSLRVRPVRTKNGCSRRTGKSISHWRASSHRLRPLHHGESRCIEPRHPSASST